MFSWQWMVFFFVRPGYSYSPGAVMLSCTQPFHETALCLFMLSTLDTCVLLVSVSWAEDHCLPRCFRMCASAKAILTGLNPLCNVWQRPLGTVWDLLQEFSQGGKKLSLFQGSGGRGFQHCGWRGEDGQMQKCLRWFLKVLFTCCSLSWERWANLNHWHKALWRWHALKTDVLAEDETRLYL